MKAAKDLGFKVTASFVLGLPGESEKTVQQTIDFIEKIDADQILINPLIPLPGSDIYENPKEYGVKIIDRKLDDYVQFVVETKSLSKEQLKKAFFRMVGTISSKNVDERTKGALGDLNRKRKS